MQSASMYDVDAYYNHRQNLFDHHTKKVFDFFLQNYFVNLNNLY